MKIELKRVILTAWCVLGLLAFHACYYFVGEMRWNWTWNAVLEFGGSVFLMNNVFRILEDKMVRGYYWPATVWFTVWGWANVFYYPSVGDWYSFTGGLFIVTVNTYWLSLAYKYRNN